MADGKAVDVLFKLMRHCNRSLPHMELLKYSLCILLNLSKVCTQSVVEFQFQVLTEIAEGANVMSSAVSLPHDVTRSAGASIPINRWRQMRHGQF